MTAPKGSCRPGYVSIHLCLKPDTNTQILQLSKAMAISRTAVIASAVARWYHREKAFRKG